MSDIFDLLSKVYKIFRLSLFFCKVTKMDLKRYHFFCPPLKGDVSCQSVAIVDDSSDKKDTEQKLYEQTLDSLLMLNQTHRSPIQRSVQQGYMQSIGFLRAVYNDERFDLIRPPKKLLDFFNISFHFEFYPTYFTISTIDASQSKTFPYNKMTAEIFRSIQLGFISSNLCFLFACFGSTTWVNGEMVIKVTDYRFDQPKTYVFPLKLSNDVIMSVSETKNLKPDQSIQYQKNAVLLKNPYICLDPSPDVARAKSVMDCRKKMWIGDNPRTTIGTPTFAKTPDVPSKYLIKKIDPQRPIQNIRVPSSILNMLENAK